MQQQHEDLNNTKIIFMLTKFNLSVIERDENHQNNIKKEQHKLKAQTPPRKQSLKMTREPQRIKTFKIFPPTTFPSRFDKTLRWISLSDTKEIKMTWEQLDHHRKCNERSSYHEKGSRDRQSFCPLLINTIWLAFRAEVIVQTTVGCFVFCFTSHTRI